VAPGCQGIRFLGVFSLSSHPFSITNLLRLELGSGVCGFDVHE